MLNDPFIQHFHLNQDDYLPNKQKLLLSIGLKPIILWKLKIPGWLRWQSLIIVHYRFSNFFLLFVQESFLLPIIIHNHLKE